MRASQLPLTSLRAFEAAARLLSFKAAAGELNVTPTAVSHQIQSLERSLGVELFVRVHRGLVLTPAGRSCLPFLKDGFDSLCAAFEALRQYRENKRLSVSAPPSFTMRILMPLTHEYLAQRSDVDLSITTRMREPNQRDPNADVEADTLDKWAEAADVVVTFGNGVAPQLEVEELLPLSLTLVCSPAMLRGSNAIKSLKDVKKVPWLHDDRGLKYGNASFWNLWLEAAGVGLQDTDEGSHFTHAAVAIDAAASGKGLLVTTPQLCRAELKSGRLVAPFDISVKLEISYYLLHRKTVRPVVYDFKRWLKEAVLSSQ